MTIRERVRPYTMTPPQATEVLTEAVREVVVNRIAGVIVECGVWRGGSMMAVALTLMEIRKRRDLFLFDTFSGMPEPSKKDGQGAHDQFLAEGDWCLATLPEVRNNLRLTGYPERRIHYVVGPVEKTIPKAAPDSIALLRLDTDWYTSIRHELEYLFPRLSPGGILIIDDYFFWPGCKTAVDEYFNGTVKLETAPGQLVVVRK